MPLPGASSVDDVDSKHIRSQYRQCQKCWKRKSECAKLMACSKCKIAAYCSVECQKADWNFHKQACNANQEYRKLMAEHDQLEKELRALSGDTESHPTTLEVNTEMGEFLRRFRPAMCQASYRCLGIQKGNVDAWKKYVFIIKIERIPHPKRESKPWSRYKIVDAGTELVDSVKQRIGDGLLPTLKQGEIFHEENVRVGCTGTIMTFLECDSAMHLIRLISWAGYEPDCWDDDVPVEDWKGELVKSVEKACGRLSWYVQRFTVLSFADFHRRLRPSPFVYSLAPSLQHCCSFISILVTVFTPLTNVYSRTSADCVQLSIKHVNWQLRNTHRRSS